MEYKLHNQPFYYRIRRTFIPKPQAMYIYEDPDILNWDVFLLMHVSGQLAIIRLILCSFLRLAAVSVHCPM
jgi:hypothetical protein